MKLLKILFGVLIAGIFAIIGANITYLATGLNPIISGSVYFVGSMLPMPNGVACFNIFNAPGGIAAPFTFQLNYLPEHLSFTNVVPLTSLKVETTEDGVLHDFTAAGLEAVGNFMVKGVVPANTLQFRLADGELRPKNVTISGVTSAAGIVPFFIASDRIGKLAIQTKNSLCLANNPTTYEKFTALFIPTMATVTDRAEVTYNSGLQQTYNMEDLLRLSSNFQNVAGVIINNYTSYINSVKLTTAANTPVYVISIKIPGQPT